MRVHEYSERNFRAYYDDDNDDGDVSLYVTTTRAFRQITIYSSYEVCTFKRACFAPNILYTAVRLTHTHTHTRTSLYLERN